jgi:hypothetical protein
MSTSIRDFRRTGSYTVLSEISRKDIVTSKDVLKNKTLPDSSSPNEMMYGS